jgi:transcriptional regulator with XRE-family HTH domain
MTQTDAGKPPGPRLLKLFRDTHDLSLEDVAKGIGCSRSLVYEYEEEKKTPELKKRRRIAKFTEQLDPDSGAARPFIPISAWDKPGEPDIAGVVPYEQQDKAAS